MFAFATVPGAAMAGSSIALLITLYLKRAEPGNMETGVSRLTAITRSTSRRDRGFDRPLAGNHNDRDRRAREGVDVHG